MLQKHCKSNLLQKGISKGTTNDRVASADGVACTNLIQAGVDLDEVERDQGTSLGDTLRNEISLAERQTTSNGCASAGCPHGVECIDVERQMDGCVAADPCQCHVHDLADAVSAYCQ